MKILIRFVFLTLLLLSPAIQAQHVYRCTGDGKTTYSDKPCHDERQGRRIQVKPNSLDTSAELAHADRQQSRSRQEQEAWAQEHQRQSAALQNTAAEQRHEKERLEQLRSATTPIPGARGGLLKSQRDAAVGLARTQKERDELMREATTVMPGAQGITASQRDAASRLSAASRGLPMPPPAARPPPPPPPPAPELPSPAPSGQVANCGPAGCWDTSGMRYNAGSGGALHRSDGKFCTRSGPTLQCN